MKTRILLALFLGGLGLAPAHADEDLVLLCDEAIKLSISNRGAEIDFPGMDDQFDSINVRAIGEGPDKTFLFGAKVANAQADSNHIAGSIYVNLSSLEKSSLHFTSDRVLTQGRGKSAIMLLGKIRLGRAGKGRTLLPNRAHKLSCRQL